VWEDIGGGVVVVEVAEAEGDETMEIKVVVVLSDKSCECRLWFTQFVERRAKKNVRRREGVNESDCVTEVDNDRVVDPLLEGWVECSVVV
jgi:hypothetical protein